MNYAFLKFLDVNRVNSLERVCHLLLHSRSFQYHVLLFWLAKFKIEENNNWHNFRNKRTVLSRKLCHFCEQKLSKPNWRVTSFHCHNITAKLTDDQYHQLTWYNSLWLWRWLAQRLSKRQSLSTTAVLFDYVHPDRTQPTYYHYYTLNFICLARRLAQWHSFCNKGGTVNKERNCQARQSDYHGRNDKSTKQTEFKDSGWRSWPPFMTELQNSLTMFWMGGRWSQSGWRWAKKKCCV